MLPGTKHESAPAAIEKRMTREENDSTAAWETVFRRSYPSVYRALVAELLDAHLAGWLFRVALRRARRIRGFGLPLRLDELVGALREPEIPAETEALLDRLEVGELLRLLTRRQRAVVVGHYYLALTQQEIADALGVRRGTVGATLSQALQHMRRGGSHVF